jgi:large subunit ribosomal protein L22
MAIIEGKSSYIRTSARKFRLVVPLAKGFPPEKAITALDQSTKRAALPLIKTIKQVVANAANNLKLEESNLIIKNILIEEGPTYKRWRAGARGRAKPILKRTSHIRVILEAKPQEKSKHKIRNSKQAQNSKSK